jgi:threonine dehydratase
MALSLGAKKAVWCPDGGKTDTIAHGLAPPFAGRACYSHVAAFVDEIVSVTDDELRAATRALYDAGVLAEVSGAAAVAAVLAGKVSGGEIVCTVSGRNIDAAELEHALSDRAMAPE